MYMYVHTVQSFHCAFRFNTFFQIHESESSDTESCKGIGREEDDEPEDIKMPENASMEKLIQEARMKAAELREKSMVTLWCS